MLDFKSRDIKTPKNSNFIKYVLLSLVLFAYANSANATTYQTIPAGSYVIDMGVVPQTNENGLRPYGLVFELIKNQGVAVQWSLNPKQVEGWN